MANALSVLNSWRDDRRRSLPAPTSPDGFLFAQNEEVVPGKDGQIYYNQNSDGVDPNVLKKGSFGMNLTAMEQFLLNLSSTFIITLMGEFKQQDRTAFDQMLKRIAGLFVLLVDGIFKLSSLRNSANDCKAINYSQSWSIWFHFSSYGTGRSLFVYVRFQSKRSS